ncbi:MAG: VCBS repeat-containing protein [Pirellulales bacterium]
MMTRFATIGFCSPRFRLVVLAAFGLICSTARPANGDEPWKRHQVWQGGRTNTAVGGDFTGDGKPDVVCTTGGITRLLVAPDWRPIVLDEAKHRAAIHAEVFDVDSDGDLDYIGAQYQPGNVFWLETPAKPLEDRWIVRTVDDQIVGVHGLLKGDVDGDGKPELIANSAQPLGPFPSSAVFLKVPTNPHAAASWERHVFAERDAGGLSHYFGFGDVDGDGRPDIALAAKGGNEAASTADAWFAWWQAPADPKAGPWKKHLIADHLGGATNIQQADVNGDGRSDFIATRGHGRGVIWFEQSSAGPTVEGTSGWKLHEIDAEILEPHSLQVVDMDADGDIDAATCAYGDKVYAWYENDGRGRFTKHVVGTDQAAYDLRAFDMDVDGDLDLLVAGQASENVVWFENPRK